MAYPEDRVPRLAVALDDDQRLLRESARSFARSRLLPGAAARDEEERFPSELIGELGEMGMLAMKVPAEFGGSEADNVGYVLAMQAISEACASVAVILASSNLSSKILADHGTDEQRRRWLAPYAAGTLGPCSFALTEPGGGSDARALRTTARKDGESYVLDGSKMWITSGAQAGFHLVFAKTDPGGGKHGISCFLVERGTPGLVVGAEERKMGLRSSGTVALHFEGCRVPVDQRIGPENGGYGAALGALAAGRIGIAAQALGIAEAGYAHGLDFASNREAFGKRVTDFQNTRFVLADCRTELDAAWLLTFRAARLLDGGDPARAASSMAKVFATEACAHTVDAMLQLHGGFGYSREYPIERLYRDARVTRIYEGTNEIQRLVISRELLRDLEAG